MLTDHAVTEFPTALAQQALKELVTRAPLVHCLTNHVVQNFTANLLLAAGAVPAMIIEPREIVEFAAVADGLLINVGTLTESSSEALALAATEAGRHALPWVLDPVAVGGLTFRTEFCQRLISLDPTVIRGNAAEICALIGESSLSRGPDSQQSSAQGAVAARTLAQQSGSIVVVTGERDYITDGQKTFFVDGGSALATRVTGAGCALSALTAAFVGLRGDDLVSAAAACWLMKRAAEYARPLSVGPGSFALHLLDGLYRIPQETLNDAL